MFSYHSNSESTVSQIHDILDQERIPLWYGAAANTKDDMRDRYGLQNIIGRFVKKLKCCSVNLA
jgi:hypothetical protein